MVADTYPDVELSRRETIERGGRRFEATIECAKQQEKAEREKEAGRNSAWVSLRKNLVVVESGQS